MARLLQAGQVEAHISRLTNIKTQLQTYMHQDTRAAKAIPAIELAIQILREAGEELEEG